MQFLHTTHRLSFSLSRLPQIHLFTIPKIDFFSLYDIICDCCAMTSVHISLFSSGMFHFISCFIATYESFAHSFCIHIYVRSLVVKRIFKNRRKRKIGDQRNSIRIRYGCLFNPYISIRSGEIESIKCGRCNA